jgi:integrase
MKSRKQNVSWIKSYQKSGQTSYGISFMFRGWNIRKRGFISADEALLEGTRIRTLIIQGKYNPDQLAEKVSRLTLVNYYNSVFIPAKSNTLKATTLRTYKQCFTNWIQPVVGSVLVQQIAGKHFHRILDTMDTEGKSPSTKKNVMSVLGAIINHAVSSGYRDTSVKAPVVSAPVANKRILSPLEVAKLIRSAQQLQGDDFARMIKFLYLSGTRIGEAVALRVQDIDFDKGTITIAQRYYEAVSEGNWGLPKNGKVQTIPIHPELVDCLLKQVEVSKNKNSDLLFSDETGCVISPRKVREQMKRVANNVVANPEEITPHALRRSIASTLVDNNIPLDAVADYMRHGTEVLQNHYNQPNRKQFRNKFSNLKLVVNEID